MVPDLNTTLANLCPAWESAAQEARTAARDLRQQVGHLADPAPGPAFQRSIEMQRTRLEREAAEQEAQAGAAERRVKAAAEGVLSVTRTEIVSGAFMRQHQALVFDFQRAGRLRIEPE